MNWIRTHRRSAVLIGLTLLVPVVLYLYAVTSLLGSRSAIQSEIDGLQPRVARVQGVLASRAALEAAIQSAGASAGMVYGSAQDQASVSAALQAEVRRLLTEAGMTITNSQVLPPERLESFDRMAISVMATGDVTALDAALTSLAQYRPMLLIEGLDVYPKRLPRNQRNKGIQDVTARFQIMSLRSAS